MENVDQPGRRAGVVAAHAGAVSGLSVAPWPAPMSTTGSASPDQYDVPPESRVSQNMPTAVVARIGVARYAGPSALYRPANWGGLPCHLFPSDLGDVCTETFDDPDHVVADQAEMTERDSHVGAERNVPLVSGAGLHESPEGV